MKLPRISYRTFFSLLAIAMLITALFSLFFAFNKNKSAYKVAERTFRGYIIGELNVFNRNGYSTNTRSLMANLFEGLLKLDENGKVAGGMAYKRTVSEDGKEYRFFIRDDVRWSDGTQVVAYDFELGIKKFISYGQGMAIMSTFFAVKNVPEYLNNHKQLDSIGVKAEGDKVLVIKLSAPVGYFEHIVADSMFFLPLPSHVINKNSPPDSISSLLIKHRISNGPYKLTSLIGDKKIFLKRNLHYYRYQDIKIKSASYMLINNNKMSNDLLFMNILDIASLTQNNVTAAQGLNQHRHISTGNATYFYVVNDFIHKKHASVIKAISMAIDRDRLALATGDLRLRASYSIAPPQELYSKPIASFMRYDSIPISKIPPSSRIENAKLLMSSMGFSSVNRLKLRFVVPSPSMLIDTFKDLKYSLKRIFIDVKIVAKSHRKYENAINNGNYDIIIVGWASDYRNPMAFMNLFRSKGGSNVFKFNNLNFDNILDRAEGSVSSDNRAFLRAESILINTGNVIPAFVSSQYIRVVSGRLMDYALFPYGYDKGLQYLSFN